MSDEIRRLVQQHFSSSTRSVTSLGGGFYGRAYLAELYREPYRAVIKIYRFPGIARNEARQLEELARHGIIRTPAVYFVEAGGNSCEALGMEYIDGVNAGSVSGLPEGQREEIADLIVDNLLGYHGTKHACGFGSLDDNYFVPDWRDYYRPVAERTLKKAETLLARGELDQKTCAVVERAVDQFDRIFYLPITQAGLVHGDYNTWNILLDRDLRHVAGVIDPFRCCWADPEFDLYQLDNANGPYFRLLGKYREKAGLSENFEQKKLYYQLFTELNHYCDAGVPVAGSSVPAQAEALKGFLI